MRRIVFYSEASVFGGHESMAIAAFRACAKFHPDIEISWVINGENERLKDALRTLGASYICIKVQRLKYFLRNPFKTFLRIWQAVVTLRDTHADLVVVVQGGITAATCGIVAARLAHLDICSYVPMTHRPSELKLHRFVAVRDQITRYLYRIVPNYITIDEIQAQRIRCASPHASVMIVENFISQVHLAQYSRSQSKERLGISKGVTVVAVIARIEFAQKSQDWVIRQLSGDSFPRSCVLLFVGEGPDFTEFSRMVESSPERNRIISLNWTKDIDAIYDAIDLLLIPSRAEGVPLVMLEALARRIPVVGTDLDGMKSWLPPHWRFQFRDAAGMKQAIENALFHPVTEDWRSILQHLEVVTDEKRFANGFRDAFIRCSF